MDAANNCIGASAFPEDLQIYSNDIDIPKLKIQLEVIPDRILKALKPLKVTNVRFFCDVINKNEERNVFQSNQLILNIFTLLVTRYLY